jgi:hypothetical protein
MLLLLCGSSNVYAPTLPFDFLSLHLSFIRSLKIWHNDLYTHYTFIYYFHSHQERKKAYTTALPRNHMRLKGNIMRSSGEEIVKGCEVEAGLGFELPESHCEVDPHPRGRGGLHPQAPHLFHCREVPHPAPIVVVVRRSLALHRLLEPYADVMLEEITIANEE